MKIPTNDSRIAGFLGMYLPPIESQLREARGILQKLFPRGFELVFDNYNALVFAFGASEKSSEAFVSVAGYPRWVTLFFRDGVYLSDPAGLIEGKGKKIRSIRLKFGADLKSPAIRASASA